MSVQGQIDQQIKSLGDWRGELYSTLRNLINTTAPMLKENWKWSTAVWSGASNVCAVAAFKNHVKINFFKGALLKDPDHLFNNGLESKESRSIDFFEDTKIKTAELANLIKEAAIFDQA